jgi:hypothetical protein
MTEEQLLAIDDGRRRSLHDVAGMAGNLGSPFLSSIIKEMMLGGYHQPEKGRNRKPSRPDFIGFLNKHQTAAAFAEKLFNKPSSGFQLGFLAAILARASYSEDTSRLTHFSDVLVSGKYQVPEDEPIITLRNFIQRVRAKSRATSLPTKNEIYAKAEKTLWDWLRGQTSTNLYGAKEELFPLEDDGKLPHYPSRNEGDRNSNQ